MLRKMLCLTAALMICLACAGIASADLNDLVLITNPYGTVMFDSYDLENTRPIALIPYGSTALCIAEFDWGYCVVFGNYAGYIPHDDGMRVSAGFYAYELPTGVDYSYPEDDEWENDDSWDDGNSWEDDGWDCSYVPEFPYASIGCEPLEDQIATRSGPNRGYTWEGNHSARLHYRVFYRTEGDGIDWAYIEFSKYDEKYRLYTGMWRLEPVQSVPYAEEEFVWSLITCEHTPRMGPGFDYAACDVWAIPGPVKAFYQENGWLMFECELADGETLRCWAPPEHWK